MLYIQHTSAFPSHVLLMSGAKTQMFLELDKVQSQVGKIFPINKTTTVSSNFGDNQHYSAGKEIKHLTAMTNSTAVLNCTEWEKQMKSVLLLRGKKR